MNWWQLSIRLGYEALFAQAQARECAYEASKVYRSPFERAYWQRQAANEAKRARIALFQIIGDGCPEDEVELT